MSKPLLTLLLASLLVAPACGSDTPSDPGTSEDASSGDTSNVDAETDIAVEDTGGQDTAVEDTGDEDTTEPDVPEDVAVEDVEDTSEDVTTDVPSEDVATDVPEVMEDVTTDIPSEDVTTDVPGEDVMEDAPDVMEDVAVDVEPDVPSEDVMEDAPDVMEDVAVDVEPDVPSEDVTDDAPDVMEDVAVDVEPDVPAELCPDTAWRQALPDPPFFDCSREAPPVGPSRIIPNARGYHGLAFDDSGNIVGNDNTSLLRHKVDGVGGLWVPGVGTVQQMAFLLPEEGETGQTDMVAGDFNGLLRVTPEGSTSTLTPDLNIYGLEIGPDGMVYAAGSSGVWRIDPETNSYETLLPGGAGFTPHTITFNANYTLMLIGTLDGFSGGLADIIAYELDCDLNPIGERIIYASDVGGGYHDALSFDICGNLYICDFSGSSLWRVPPGPQVPGKPYNLGASHELLIDWEIGGDALNSYGHGFVWGTGENGWRPDAAYVPLPYASDQVKEVIIGIPGVRWNGRGLIE